MTTVTVIDHVLIWVGAVTSVAFVVLYGCFRRWWASKSGRIIMFRDVTFALLFVASLVGIFARHLGMGGIYAGLGIVALVVLAQLVWLGWLISNLLGSSDRDPAG